MKALGNMDRIQLSNEVALLLLSLYESKGKSFYYDDLFSRDSNAFERKTLETNLIAIAGLLELKMTDQRMKLFAKKEMAARTKDEFLFNNVKKALTQLHQSPEAFELLTNEIVNLTKLLSKQYENIQFQTFLSQEEGILLKNKKISKRESLDKLIEIYEKNLRSSKYELTQLISNFYIDFLNMEIFDRESDLIAYILLYALLFRHFTVFKYVSFFDYFANEKEAWKLAKVSANYYWEQGFSQTDHLSRILIGVLIACYKEVDGMAHEYVFEKELNKSNNIENSILKLGEIFTKDDLRKRHPNVSDATIDRTLKRLKDEDKIRPLGKGRTSKWQRIVKGNNKKFGSEQLSLFND